jgi:hypothetical protein
VRRPARDNASRNSFELSPTRYGQTRNARLDLPPALTYAPPLVDRLELLRTGTTRGRQLG